MSKRSGKAGRILNLEESMGICVQPRVQHQRIKHRTGNLLHGRDRARMPPLKKVLVVAATHQDVFVRLALPVIEKIRWNS